jgi:hypothetical protein
MMSSGKPDVFLDGFDLSAEVAILHVRNYLAVISHPDVSVLLTRVRLPYMITPDQTRLICARLRIFTTKGDCIGAD